MSTLPSKLDERQVLQNVHDEDRQTLRVDATVFLDGTGPLGDNVSIVGETGNKLVVNPDGTINVNTDSIPGVVKNVFNELLAVASGTTVNLVTYTVPVGKTAIINKIVVSGDNIAKYELYINGVLSDKLRTYFGSQLNVTFDFKDLTLEENDILLIKVNNFRPSVADFNGRIQISEV